MGMYPSADLLYGIDLGMEDKMERPGWFTEELEEEHGGMAEVLDHLLRGTGVRYGTYGNLCSGCTGLALCTQSVHATAYDAEPVGIDRLTDTAEEDDKALEAAWTVLYPGQTMPEPGWFIVVGFG